MNGLFPKRVLITQGELMNYAGSEIVTLELAEHFSSMGSVVHVLSNVIRMPIEKEFKKLKNVVLHTTPHNISFEDLELIWIHHQLIPQAVLDLAEQGLLKAKIVFHHMSPYHPLEFPFAAKIEHALADLILFNSHESKRAIETKLGGFGLRGKVFNNPAPDHFHVSHAEKSYRKKLKRILVVSNHIPDELTAAIDMLKKQGIAVKVFGISGSQGFKRISAEDLSWADVVISIGKTVQYAILGGVPVYCYDHFGGCGYFNSKNFRKAARLNFSGRGFAKKEPEDISNELVNGYAAAQVYARHLHKTATSEYKLSNKLITVLNDLMKRDSRQIKRISKADKASFEAFSKHLWSMHNQLCGVNDAYGALSMQHKSLADEHARLIAALEGEVSFLREQLSDLLSSKSWKLTEPLRQANKQFKRRDLK